jgi:hypothetical protein
MKNLESINAKTKTKRRRKSLLIDESIKKQFRTSSPKRKSAKSNSWQLSKILWIILLVIIMSAFSFNLFSSKFPSLKSQNTVTPSCIWEICAIDTMKTSRDRARAELNNPAYDEDIKQQLKLIKQTGATYVTVSTPYDEEFMPYLKRWVTLSRSEGLKVWFRGNWSNWEGWFEYPKNLGPAQHTAKTKNFISAHPELFESGDIFDPCPECENSGFWPQDGKNADYRKFVINQQKEITTSFKEINKDVTVYQSIIGGRAKDVLDKPTFDSLGNIIGIDHYVKSPSVMEEFINYFWNNSQTRSLVTEFGAPIPDLNGPMNDTQQAEFVKQVLEVLYKHRDKVHGLNYWVLSEGTTGLINLDGTPKPAFYTLQGYFIPGEVYGNIKNPLNEGLSRIQIKTTDGISSTFTDDQGNFRLSIPPRKVELEIGNVNYEIKKVSLNIEKSGQRFEKNFTLTPNNPGLLYRLRLWWQSTQK